LFPNGTVFRYWVMIQSLDFSWESLIETKISLILVLTVRDVPIVV